MAVTWPNNVRPSIEVSFKFSGDLFKPFFIGTLDFFDLSVESLIDLQPILSKSSNFAGRVP
jgi:hypothetical protein